MRTEHEIKKMQRGGERKNNNKGLSRRSRIQRNLEKRRVNLKNYGENENRHKKSQQKSNKDRTNDSRIE